MNGSTTFSFKELSEKIYFFVEFYNNLVKKNNKDLSYHNQMELKFKKALLKEDCSGDMISF